MRSVFRPRGSWRSIHASIFERQSAPSPSIALIGRVPRLRAPCQSSAPEGRLLRQRRRARWPGRQPGSVRVESRIRSPRRRRRSVTTNQGVPIADDQNSLQAVTRGPVLLEDFVLREKITHFDHERIPERIVHARGSARARVLSGLPLARQADARGVPAGSREEDAGLRALLHGRGRRRLGRHRRATCAASR